jgi:hypothetical protein
MPKDPRGIGHVGEPCQVDAELGDLLKSLGFDPGVPIYRATPIESFEEIFDSVKKELLGTWMHDHEPIHITFRQRDRRHTGWPIEAIVELLHVIHKPLRIAPDGPITTSSSRRLCDPDWYLRGAVLHFPLEPPVARLHAYIQTEPETAATGWPHGIVVQAVNEPSGADARTPLMWGIGVPGWPR